jgi:hypothetical protein
MCWKEIQKDVMSNEPTWKLPIKGERIWGKWYRHMVISSLVIKKGRNCDTKHSISEP